MCISWRGLHCQKEATGAEQRCAAEADRLRRVEERKLAERALAITRFARYLFAHGYLLKELVERVRHLLALPHCEVHEDLVPLQCGKS